MAHPLLARFCGAVHPINPAFIRKCQREFHAQIQPVWDEAIALREENATLRQQIADLKANPPKRPRGRPRKVQPSPEVEATV